MAYSRPAGKNYDTISERHGDRAHRSYDDPNLSTGTYRHEYRYQGPHANADRSVAPVNLSSRSRCPGAKAERSVAPVNLSSRSRYSGAQGTSSSEVTVEMSNKLVHQIDYQDKTPVPSRRGRWSDAAGSTLDNYKFKRAPAVSHDWIRKARGPQFEMQTVSNLAVEPPIELPTNTVAYNPNRGWELNETQVHIRGGPDVDALERHQRQVNFDATTGSLKEKKEKALSLLKRFDRDVTVELQKRRQSNNERDMQVLHSTGAYEATRSSAIGQPLSSSSMAGKSYRSVREIQTLLRETPQTALLEAVDSLAQAEAAVAYDGAVRAAEEAAALAPPELAEEAAAAGARNYRAEITDSVQEVLAGEKPIEIIGYVGITRPIKD